MTNEEQNQFIETINKYKPSNSKFYDAAILVLSSVGFIFAMIITSNNQEHPNIYLLHISWALFVISLSATLSSFHFHDIELDGTHPYNYYQTSLWLNWITPISLLIAFIALMVFIALQ